jgi:hypothetical protein
MVLIADIADSTKVRLASFFFPYLPLAQSIHLFVKKDE